MQLKLKTFIFFYFLQKCLDDSECHPRDARLERVSTLQGVKVVETIDTCDCFPRQFCSRESYKQVVHVGTPYQIVIDIGVCIGQCKGKINFNIFEVYLYLWKISSHLIKIPMPVDQC